MNSGFDEIITSPDRLREIIGRPSHRVLNKVIDQIDDICEKYIAASPYVIVATRGVDGLLDISPKGDPAGFVLVKNPKTLVIPDRLGNRRIDSFENLLANPEVALFFMIPDHSFTLRVSGTGKIVRDAALQQQLAVKGKTPDLLLAVNVEEAFLHCAKSIVRANLWNPGKWPGTTSIPSLAEGMVAHANLSEGVDSMQARINEDDKTRLY